MIANYHTHTTRCNHATGTMQEYVENAIQRGMKIFGFSDHTPQYFPGDYYTFMRMRPYELPEYCADIQALRREYGNQIQILTGLEVEYYPAIWNELVSRAHDMGIEYFILGQHWLGNEQNEPGSAAPTTEESLLRRYCHQVCDAIQTGKISYVAHPDLLNYVGDKNVYRRHMRDLCRAAKQSDTPLEINFLGIATGRNYPNPCFWEVAAEEGCKTVLGMDAHAPDHIINPEPEKKALEMVRYYGLELLETVNLRKI